MIIAALRAWAFTAAMPQLGTFLHPNLSVRGSYHWTFPNTNMSCTNARILFGDVNRDGKDDLIRAGCGKAGNTWAVSLSTGISGWKDATAWSDGSLPTAYAEEEVQSVPMSC